MEEMTLAAALYFEPQLEGSIPWSCLTAAKCLLEDRGLPVHEIAFEPIRGKGGGHWCFAKYERRVLHETQKGNVNFLALYSNPVKSDDLIMDWYGLAWIDLTRGAAFLGLPPSPDQSPTSHLRRAYQLYRNTIHACYGNANFHPRRRGPSFFALGILARPAGTEETTPETLAYGDRVCKWNDELREQRRHLRGWFRDVFPANLLSEAHLDVPLRGGLTLRTADLGHLIPLETGLWLWEVPDQQIEQARNALQQAGVLVCC